MSGLNKLLIKNFTFLNLELSAPAADNPVLARRSLSFDSAKSEGTKLADCGVSESKVFKLKP
ncbi:MAG: hypothetical protein HY093_03390 [Candidatus Liptonbacteria bacterium]|nr:hypothetical protein [Candidatus Liptonbacteria bacterium]